MAADPSVVINLAAEFVGKKAFKQADTATQKLSHSVKTLGKTIGITFGAAKVLGYAKASIMAAAKDQKAQVQLALALKNVGLERDAASAERFIAGLQKEFGVVDDLLRPAYQKLAIATKSTAETQKLLSLSLDVSAATGKDLDAVTSALSKAYLGNNTALSKLGIGISKADLKTKSFDVITNQLSDTFKGAATAAANTFAGSIAKLGVAAENSKEIIGKGLIDSLMVLGKDTNASNLATQLESVAQAIADIVLGISVITDKLAHIPGAGIVKNILGALNPLAPFQMLGAQERRKAEVAKQKNPIQAGTYLKIQTKITKQTKEQAVAQSKILADKKSQAILDKANLALGKGADVFNMDAIQLNAALIGQAEALGKATTGAQALAIANDIQRLRVKQDIAALEDAIASKDDAAIVKATTKLNADLQILGTLQNQSAKLVDINNILASMKPKDLINLENLNQALALLMAMAGVKISPQAVTAATVLGITKSAVAGVTMNPTQNQDRNYDAASAVVAQNAASNALAGSGQGAGAGEGQIPKGVSVTINAGVISDPNAFVGLIQDTILQINKRGDNITTAGAL